MIFITIAACSSIVVAYKKRKTIGKKLKKKFEKLNKKTEKAEKVPL